MDFTDLVIGRPSFDSRRMSFGAWAEYYDTYRPGYSAEVVEWLLGNPTPGTRLRVLDLAAGTGRLGQTAQELGHDVVAVEPDDAMREFAAGRIGTDRVFAGTAESIPLESGSVDVVTVGTAWHWFNQDAAPAEIARVLAPGGLLSVTWNLRDDRVPWVSEFDTIVDGQNRVLRETDVRWKILGSHFAEPEEARIAHDTTLPADGLVGLARSMSYVALRPDAEELFAQVDELGRRHLLETNSDTFTMPWVALCYRTRKVAD